MNLNESLVTLFKCYTTEASINPYSFDEKCIRKGILISKDAPEEVKKLAIHLYGKDGTKWNQTLHKSFDTVATKEIGELILQQVMHYFTTYGFEMLDIYSPDTVYIPHEKLEIPELKEDIPMVSIYPALEATIVDKIKSLVGGVALSKKTIQCLLVLADEFMLPNIPIDEVKNRELKIALYDKWDMVPSDPEEFLRYLIYKGTGNTLKIQNKNMYHLLKYGRVNYYHYFELYADKNGLAPLSAIFRRNKNLFLAIKASQTDTYGKRDERLVKMINKIGRLAAFNHKPMKPNILDHVLDYTPEEVITALEKATVFREIRILNGLLYGHLTSGETIPMVYRVRNGSSYSVNKEKENNSKVSVMVDALYNHLLTRLSKLKDKTVYMPENINYMVPSSEKMFNGNIPNGSYIDLPRGKDIVYGISWNNLSKEEYPSGSRRVDLDLHQSNAGEVFGWDAAYRSGSDILFSGDITDAPNGATECFYVSKDIPSCAYTLNLNNYTQQQCRVPFEFVIATSDYKPDDFANHYRSDKNHYTINPNNIIFKWDSEVEQDAYQKNVGFITIESDHIRYYFNDFANGVGRTLNKEINQITFDYLQNYSKTQLRLRDLLKDVGATLVSSPTLHMKDVNGNDVEVKVDYDLSLEAITKDTLIGMLQD